MASILFICDTNKYLQRYYPLLTEIYHYAHTYYLSTSEINVDINKNATKLIEPTINYQKVNEIITTFNIKLLVYFYLDLEIQLNEINIIKICHYFNRNENINDKTISQLRQFHKIVVSNPSLAMMLHPYINNVQTISLPIIPDPVDIIPINNNSYLNNDYIIYSDITNINTWYQLDSLFKIIDQLVKVDTCYKLIIDITDVTDICVDKLENLKQYYKVKNDNISLLINRGNSRNLPSDLYLSLNNYVTGNKLLLFQNNHIPVVATSTHITRDLIINGSVVQPQELVYDINSDGIQPRHNIKNISNEIINIKNRDYATKVMANTISKCYCMCLMETKNYQLSYTSVKDEITKLQKQFTIMVLDFKSPGVTQAMSRYNQEKTINMGLDYQLVNIPIKDKDYYKLILEKLHDYKLIIQLWEFDYILDTKLDIISAIYTLLNDKFILINSDNGNIDLKNSYILVANQLLETYCNDMLSGQLDNYSIRFKDNIYYNLDPLSIKSQVNRDKVLFSPSTFIINLNTWSSVIKIWEPIISCNNWINHQTHVRDLQFNVDHNNICLHEGLRGTINGTTCQWNLINQVLTLYYLDGNNVIKSSIDIRDNILSKKGNFRSDNTLVHTKDNICIIYVTDTDHQDRATTSFLKIKEYANYHGYQVEICSEITLAESIKKLSNIYQYALITRSKIIVTNISLSLSNFIDILNPNQYVLVIDQPHPILENLVWIRLSNITDAIIYLIKIKQYQDTNICKQVSGNSLKTGYFPSIDMDLDLDMEKYSIWKPGHLFMLLNSTDDEYIKMLVSTIET